jgi:hypothetical protein
MYNVFVGYNPTVIPGYFAELADVDARLFQATILVPVKAKSGTSSGLLSTAEATYRLPESTAEIRCDPPLPIEELNWRFLQNGTDGRPMTFLQANRCLAGFLFLRALAEAAKTSKRVINFEDGGYIHPMLEMHVDKQCVDTSVKKFREDYGIPPEPETDIMLGNDCLAYLVKRHFVGTCELTRNGYNSTCSIWEKRKALTGEGYLNTRFFSIAASYGKIKLEGNNIALACLNGLEQVLYSIGWSLSRRKVVVLGARGSLGRLCCKHLANITTSGSEEPTPAPRVGGENIDASDMKNENVWGVDLKVNWAKPNPDDTPWWLESSDLPVEGIGGEYAGYKDIPKEHRLGFEIIFGWTGGPTFDINDPSKRYGTYDGNDLAEWLLEGCKPVLFFASGSTKTAEFKDLLLWITSMLERPKEERIITSGSLSQVVAIDAQPIPDNLTLAAVQGAGLDPSKISRNFGYQFAFTLEQNGNQVTKVVYLVNKTMPLNFMFYGTATEIMDRSYAQVTSATAKLNTMYMTDSLSPGLYATDYVKESTEGVHLALSLPKNYNPPHASGVPAPARLAPDTNA